MTQGPISKLFALRVRTVVYKFPDCSLGRDRCYLNSDKIVLHVSQKLEWNFDSYSQEPLNDWSCTSHRQFPICAWWINNPVAVLHAVHLICEEYQLPKCFYKLGFVVSVKCNMPVGTHHLKQNYNIQKISMMKLFYRYKAGSFLIT